jgi:hypothetical protein
MPPAPRLHMNMSIALLPGRSRSGARISAPPAATTRASLFSRKSLIFVTRLSGQKDAVIIATSRKKRKRARGLRLKNGRR